MTDESLLAKKLAFIETCIRELRTLARGELIAHDVREARFVEHTLQIAIQAALDVASHIVSDRRLGEPATIKQLFELMARDGWLSPSRVAPLQAMAGFRNVLVHGYAEIDLALVRDILDHHLDDLLELVASVRARLATGA